MLTVKVDGDAAGGWMVEIHDGSQFRTFSPAGKDEWTAMGVAVDEWFGKTPAPEQPHVSP